MSKSSSETITEEEGDKVDALKAFDFGQLIAFVLPGLVATRGLALLMPSLATAFDKITKGGEGALGPLVWLLIVGATVGLTISLTRQQFLDWVFGSIYGCFPIRAEKRKKLKRAPWRPNYVAIARSEKIQTLFDKVVREVYRYYQFIANISVALAIDAGVLWRVSSVASAPSAGATTGTAPFGALKWVATGLSGFLLFTAYQQFKGWCRVHNQITSSVESQGSPSAPAAAPASAAASSPTA
jgi:hypothetical protein